MTRWLLVLKAVPVALLVLVARYIVHNTFDLSGLINFSDTGAVIAGTTIIVGLMLAGVISDYKEAEKLPAVVGSSRGGLEGLSVAALQVKDVDGAWVRPRLAAVADAIDEWFFGRLTDEQMWAKQADVSQLIVDVEKAGAPSHYVSRLLTCAGDLSGALGRIAVIRNTSFIRAGYVLMQILVGIVLVLLVIVEFSSPAVQWLVPGVLALAYVYLILLVKDLDNPFGHGDNGGRGSATDVDLTPFENVRKSLHQ